MHRIDGAGHVNHMFVAEDPATQRPPTEVTPEIMNAFQEELATLIEWAGIILAKGDNTQLRQALLAKFAGADVAATKAGVQGQTYTAFTTAGSAGTFTLTPSPAITAYAAGQRFRVKFHVAGTGSDTINVSGNGAKSIKQYDSTGAKVAPVIALNQLADAEFDGTDFVLLDPLPAALDSLATKTDVQGQTYTAFTTAGSAGTFTLTPSPAITAYAAGQRFRVKFHVAGNGADTINVAGKGAKSIKQYDNTGAKVAPVIALNQLADVEFDGTDFVILDPLPASSLPTGAVIYVPAASAPVGFLKANGALISRTAYPALWAYAQASGNIAASDGAWGAGQFSPGDGSTTFRIPDLRGEFLRGWDDGRGVDASRGLGSAQAAALGNHYHGTVSPTGYGFGYYGTGTITSDAGRDGFADFNDSTPSAKHPETRPRNIAVLACIKY